MKTKKILMLTNRVLDAYRKDNNAPYQNELPEFQFFSTQLLNKNLELFITHYKTYSEGKELAWKYNPQEKKWVKTIIDEPDLVLDRISGDIQGWRKLISEMQRKGIRVFNDPHIAYLCTDKVMTYEKFKEYSIPTYYPHDKETLIDAYERLRQENDCDIVFIKPRYGNKGKDIRVVKKGEKEKIKEINEFNDLDYILQPFIESSDGIPELGIRTRHDIRIITLNNNIEASYVRMPKANGFLSNYDLGGDLTYFGKPFEQLPTKYIELANKILKNMEYKQTKIISLDFITENDSGLVKLVELNNNTGFSDSKTRQIAPEDKQVISLYVKALDEILNKN